MIDEATELDKSLKLLLDPNYAVPILTRADPNAHQSLPGQARVPLKDDLKPYLRRNLQTSNLDKMAKHFWLAFTPKHSHISPLHYQAALGRSIIVVENPHLHLVWYYDCIYIKPLPAYLLSAAFWKYIKTDTELSKAAAGFVRTYAYLIRYELDFQKAQSDELGLIPQGDGQKPITYERFTQFIARFQDLENDKVSPRYQCGELRLTRLNWFARFFLWKLTYHHVHAQWNELFGRFLAPFLTAFLLLTTVLTAMQVELAVQSLPGSSGSWGVFSQICRWFSVVTLVLVVAVCLFLVCMFAFMTIHNLLFARKTLRNPQTNFSSTAAWF